MKTNEIAFKNIINNISDTAFAKTFMNRNAQKKSVNNTRLAKSNPSFIVARWEDEDDYLMISIRFSDTAFGRVFIGSTKKGVCFMGFVNNDPDGIIADFKRRFPSNALYGDRTGFEEEAIARMNHPEDDLPVHLHLKGTGFQISIWEKLLLVPFGSLTTYVELGGNIQNARAVGSAVAANPICYILPCHRVIRTDGSFEGYYWGTELKEKLLTYEAATTMKGIIEKGLSNSLMANFSQN